jgi:hypothetical protein
LAGSVPFAPEASRSVLLLTHSAFTFSFLAATAAEHARQAVLVSTPGAGTHDKQDGGRCCWQYFNLVRWHICSRICLQACPTPVQQPNCEGSKGTHLDMLTGLRSKAAEGSLALVVSCVVKTRHLEAAAEPVPAQGADPCPAWAPDGANSPCRRLKTVRNKANTVKTLIKVLRRWIGAPWSRAAVSQSVFVTKRPRGAQPTPC